MKTLKELEHELVLDWRSLQLLDSPLAKDTALNAYHLKHALYRKTRSWQLVLLEAVVPPQVIFKW